jgi:hypothetical protein
MRSRLPVLLLAAALATAGSNPAEGAAKAKKKPRATATPAPTPTPTPPPYLRAAGACVKYEPGQYLIVAEVGETGRAFRIDDSTSLETKPVHGTRIRIFYVEGPDGPIARRVMPGPAAVPTPVK